MDMQVKSVRPSASRHVDCVTSQSGRAWSICACETAARRRCQQLALSSKAACSSCSPSTSAPTLAASPSVVLALGAGSSLIGSANTRPSHQHSRGHPASPQRLSVWQRGTHRGRCRQHRTCAGTGAAAAPRTAQPTSGGRDRSPRSTGSASRGRASTPC